MELFLGHVSCSYCSIWKLPLVLCCQNLSVDIRLLLGLFWSPFSRVVAHAEHSQICSFLTLRSSLGNAFEPFASLPLNFSSGMAFITGDYSIPGSLFLLVTAQWNQWGYVVIPAWLLSSPAWNRRLDWAVVMVLSSHASLLFPHPVQ